MTKSLTKITEKNYSKKFILFFVKQKQNKNYLLEKVLKIVRNRSKKFKGTEKKVIKNVNLLTKKCSKYRFIQKRYKKAAEKSDFTQQQKSVEGPLQLVISFLLHHLSYLL